MKRSWQLLRVLVLRHWGIVLLLSLFYVVGFFVMLGAAGEGRWFGLAILAAFPTCGILALATERIASVCASAGALAIPGHVASVVRAQVGILVVTVGAPLMIAAIYGGELLVFATVLCAAAAVGVLIVNKAFILVGFVALAYFGQGHTDWLASPYACALILAGSAWVLFGWFRLPKTADAAGAAQVTAFAGIEHEGSDAEMAEAFAVSTDRIESYERELAAIVERHKYTPVRGVTLESLVVALGLDPKPSAKGVPFWAGVACASLIVSHLLRRGPETTVYYAVSALCGMAIITGITSVFEVWRRSAGEQSLLVLMPLWPPPSRMKRLLVRAALWKLPAAWLIWVAASGVALGVGVSPSHLLDGAVTMLGATAAGLTDLWLQFAQRSLKKVRWSTVVSLLVPGLALLSFVIDLGGAPGRWVSVSTILVLPVIAYGTLMMGKLQFPVNATDAGA